MLKKFVRSAWQSQPRWLRKKELSLFQVFLGRPLNPARPLSTGDVIVGGFLGTNSGLGKTARQMLDLFRLRGLPVQGANISRFAVLEDFEAGPLWADTAKEGGIAIFHINPDMFPLVVRAIGRQRLLSRRIVGFWAWELENLPPLWHRGLRMVDEIWVPSRFIADALRKVASNKPIYVVPPFLDVASIPTSPRQDILPQFAGRPIVFFSYDVRSVHARKNPEAVIAAFKQATAGDPNPVLILKVGNHHVWPESLSLVKRAIAGQENIHVVTEKISDNAMQDFIARADIIFSLHRSEGFGLLMVEGMAAAKPIIATGWSGNCDFMSSDCTALVDYKLVPVVDPQNVYNCYGARWAEPDIAQAAHILRRLLDNPDERRRLGIAARAHISNYLSADAIMSRLPSSFWQAIEAGTGKSTRKAV